MIKPTRLFFPICLLMVIPLTSKADCPLNSKEPKFNCSSYELGVPLNITNNIGGPSLTVMDGNVGIGILSPVATLDVQSAGVGVNDSQLILRNPSTANNSAVTTNNYSAGQWRGSQYYVKDGSGLGTVFGVSTADSSGTPTERLRIISNGNVGIGTAAPGADLDVVGTIRTDSICDRAGNNCKTITDGWGSGGGGGSGTVTSVGTGTGLTGGPITTSGTIAVDVGATANKIVQLDGSAALPAVSGVNLTNVNAVKINGTSVSASSSTNGQVLQFNGTSWTNHTLAVSDISGLATNLGSKLDAANMPASCSANQTLTFTSPTGMWACSNITITSSVFGTQLANQFMASPDGASGTPSFRSITMADLPSEVGTQNWTENSGNVYRATGNVGVGTNAPGAKLDVNGTLRVTEICDRSGTNCKTVSSGWSTGGGGTGTVTSITAGTGLTGGTITASGTFAVDVGTTANKIVQLNGSGALPAVSGANLTNITATTLSGNPVSATSPSNGHVLSFNGTAWTSKAIATSDVSGLSTALGGKLDAANMPASCSANQTLTFSSPTGMWACSNITVTPSVFGTQSQGLVLAAPASGSGTATFRALQLSDLPPGSGGTSNWSETTGGDVYRSTGKVGIGTTTPAATLEVAGALRLSGSDVDTYTTPMASAVPTKIGIPHYNPGVFGQVVSMGISSTAHSTSRVLSLFDARTSVHQPTIGVFSPNENHIVGFSFDGSNSVGYVTSTNELGFKALGTERIRLSPTSTIINGAPYENVELGDTVMGASTDYGAILNITTASRDAAAVGIRVKGTLGASGRAAVSIDTEDQENNRYLLRLTSNSEGQEVLAATTAGNIGIGTIAPGSALDVVGTIRADQICDRTGANCKTISGGWLQGGTSNEVLAKLVSLSKENAELKKQIKELTEQVKLIVQKSAPQGRNVAKAQ